MVWKCPICDSKNSEEEKYCVNCGWGRESVLPPDSHKTASQASLPVRAVLVRLDSLDGIDVTGGKTIGRSLENDIMLIDPFVSRFHARITVDKGLYFIQDLKSANGTIVNNTTILRGEKRQLNEGDVVKIGSSEFRFEFVYHPEETTR